MKERRSSRVAAVVCVVAMAAVGMGCSSDDSDGVATGTTTTDGSGGNQFADLKKIAAPDPCVNDQGVTDTEIKIGTIAPMSGPGSGSGFIPSIVDAAVARIELANDSGELGEREITVISEDDSAQADRNVSAATKLTEQDEVFAIITESFAGEASAKYLNSKGMPVVGWMLGLPMFGKYTNIFGHQNATAADSVHNYTTTPAQVIKQAGGKKLALLANASANGSVLLDQIADSTERIGGVEVVYKSADVPLGNKEYGAYAQQIKESGADSLYTAIDPQSNIALLTALGQVGVTLDTVVLPAGYDPRVTGIAAFDKAYITIEFKPLETTPEPEGMATFKAAMAKYKPDNIINQAAAVGWLSGNALIEGIKAAGVDCPTQKAFINNLRMVEGYTADGFFEPISFAEAFDKPAECTYVVQLVDKAFVPAFDGEPVCGALVENDKLVAPTTTTTTAATSTTAAG